MDFRKVAGGYERVGEKRGRLRGGAKAQVMYPGNGKSC